MNTLVSIIVMVLGLYVALLVLAFIFQERLLYFPLRRLDATPADIGLNYQTVQLQTGDGVTISGWFIPAEPERTTTVLFFHGNAGNISHRLNSIAVFHRLGLNTLIIDYRGYGQSQGRPTEPGTYHDAAAAWRYLVEERQIPPEQIVIFGRSLGGGVASWLARQRPPAALILESTFTSVPDLAVQVYPFLPARQLSRIHYDTVARLPDIHCPILIVHSPDDQVIPYRHGQRLLAAAHEPKMFLEIRGDHNAGFMTSAGEYQAGLAGFLDRYVHNQE
ncbi:MAG: alpha/beta hydrolase [Chloroflexota bacterium]